MADITFIWIPADIKTIIKCKALCPLKNIRKIPSKNSKDDVMFFVFFIFATYMTEAYV